MPKRVLLTGSAGFLGAHIVEHLLVNTDWDIVGLDSFRHRGDALRVHDGLDPDRYSVQCADLSAPIGTRLARQLGHFDFVINAASESHVDRSIEDPRPFVENNVHVMLTMLDYAREMKPDMFVQISTDEVYGPSFDGELHPEWDPILPSNPYSSSKAAQEALGIGYWRTYGVPLVIVNCMNLCGERQDPEKFIPLCISRIMRGEVIPIHGTPDNVGSRFYLHARNFADAILFLMGTLTPPLFPAALRPERFNVCGDREVDNYELAVMIAQMVNRDLLFEFVDWHGTRPGHDPRYALDGTKLTELGWTCPVHFEDSLRKTVAWTLAHDAWLQPA